ncbi:coiled-coil domain-containing protein 65 [Asbolus verrucosus]|uniref:Dynein regulatory complex subunit 2 n=1 Tax=Asbolus verrucosus TaxID=1661398 RepID=A0A482W1V1_ASBVE|nr:coiled-coil domain-containing protein 65 [Asbolus verrucosus]
MLSPKLTPEELRAKRKQIRLDRKLLIEEKKKQDKRDHLTRELAYGELTYKRYEKKWKKMLLKVALPRMREDLEFAWYNFERVVDCKDFIISLLMDEIKDAEEQYMYNFRAHLDNMDDLMETFNSRLEKLKIAYQSEVKEMKDRCDAELGSMKDMTNEKVNYLKTMLYQLAIARREQVRIKRAEFYSRLDEFEVKNNLLLQKMKAILERKYQNVFNDLKYSVQHHNKHIRQKKEQHDQLKQGDDSMQELIAQQFKQIKKLHDILRILRQKFNDMKQLKGSELLDLQSERQFFFITCLTLKANLQEELKADFDKLAYLSECCVKTFHCLESLNKKGETIMKVAAICRKLETEKEKILPFRSTVASFAYKFFHHLEDEEEPLRKELVMFWQKFGEAYSVYFQLKREKKYLEEENQVFIDSHNNYCDQLTFPTVPNYKVSINKVDGNLEMRKYPKS